MKLTLAISSLLTIALLIAAAVHENYFTEWRHSQREYKKILLSKAADENERLRAEHYPLEIRQIVVPDLKTTDRCVSCHVGIDDPRMADAPEPFRFHPGNFLENHDVDRFGCTGCHGGQGLATTRREAHAGPGVFWERIRFPPPFVESSCGVCHDPTRLKNSGAPTLARGFELFQETGCPGCHRLGERGGNLGPPLDRTGDKGPHQLPFAEVAGERTVINWHREHLKNPQRIVPQSKMPKVGLDDGEIDALVTYLLSLRKTNLTERMVPRDKVEERYRGWHVEPLAGSELYKRYCFSCHREGTESIVHETLGSMIPTIRNEDFLAVASPDLLFRTIHDGRPGTAMPAWGLLSSWGGLSDEEIKRIVSWLLEGRKRVEPVRFSVSPTADSANGKRLFEANCSTCHNMEGGGGNAPWLGSPVFQETYSDALIGHTIKYGRGGTLMNPFEKGQGGGLTDREISDLIAFIRTLK